MNPDRHQPPGDGDLPARVAVVMARLAAGDGDALWDLHAMAAPALTRILRGEARRIDVRIDDEDLFDLTIDAAIDLAKYGRAWKADGALPWVWAHRRIVALVHTYIGTFARPLDETHLYIEAPLPAPHLAPPRQVLREAAERHPSARRLEEQLTAVANDRAAAIWLGVLIEKAGGNRAPSVTIALDHGMQPAAVRKVVQRVTGRLDIAV